VSPRAVAARLDELFAPRVIGVVDDTYVKVARLHGTLAWHTHESENEAWVDSKAPWCTITDGLPQFSEGADPARCRSLSAER
jgi:hypothetical protein